MAAAVESPREAHAFADVAWSSACWGFNLDAPAGSDNWMFQQLAGITGDSLNSSQAAAIWNVNGNTYAPIGGTAITAKGTAAVGAPYFQDIVTSLDWFQRRVQEDLIAWLIANRPDYSNASAQAAGGVVLERLELGVRNGHFSADFPREVTVPDVAQVSDADKQARKLPMRCSGVFAGKLQAFDLTFYVTF